MGVDLCGCVELRVCEQKGSCELCVSRQSATNDYFNYLEPCGPFCRNESRWTNATTLVWHGGTTKIHPQRSATLLPVITGVHASPITP